jgi:hypothetical protein
MLRIRNTSRFLSRSSWAIAATANATSISYTSMSAAVSISGNPVSHVVIMEMGGGILLVSLLG